MLKCEFNKVAFNFIEITLQHECFPVNSLHIFRTPFPKNTSGRLLLQIDTYIINFSTGYKTKVVYAMNRLTTLTSRCVSFVPARTYTKQHLFFHMGAG